MNTLNPNTTLRDKMLGVTAELNSEIAEREELIHAIALALLSESNLFILGDPGQAKSFAINEFRKRITGAKQFERLLSKQTDEEALFGRLDLASMIPGAVPVQVLDDDPHDQQLKQQLAAVMQAVRQNPNDTSAVEKLTQLTEALERYRKGLSLLAGGTPMTITSGKIPDAHIVFLDEIFKAGDGIVNSLLTVLNERRYTNEGVTTDIPVISFFSASNEIPNFRNKEEQILAPLYDRFQLKVVTHNVEKRKARLHILHEKQSTQFGTVSTTITLDELYAMQGQVKLVSIPESINELMDDVLCELRRQNITVSDRKFFGFGRIAQAAAWLSGHAEVQPNDLLMLKNYLWNEPKEIETVRDVLGKLCDNPLRTHLDELLHKGRDAFAAFDAAPSVKALVPLRAAFAVLYQEWCVLDDSAQSDEQRAQTAETLSDLESLNRKAHDACHFSYSTLKELSLLQAV